MRVAQPIVLEADVRRKLALQTRGRSTAARVVLQPYRVARSVSE
jgi:hypothetical protein